jgi:hypothetical protein
MYGYNQKINSKPHFLKLGFFVAFFNPYFGMRETEMSLSDGNGKIRAKRTLQHANAKNFIKLILIFIKEIYCYNRSNFIYQI